LLVVLAVYGLIFQKLISVLRRRALFWARRDERPVDEAALH
jgi:hypothetical protein